VRQHDAAVPFAVGVGVHDAAVRGRERDGLLRVCRERRDRHPEADERPPGAGVDAAADRGANVVLEVGEMTSAHDPQGVRQQVLGVVAGIVGVRPVGAARQLPEVAAHVGQTEGALRAVEAAHRRRARRSIVRPLRPRLVSPRIDPPIRPARRLLPLRLARQPDPPAVVERLLQRRRRLRPFAERRLQPAAVGERIRPGDPGHRMVGRRLQRAGVDPMSRRLDEGGELGHGDLVAADVKGRQVHRALGARRIPALVVVGERVDSGIASHHERAGRDLHEAERLVVGKKERVGTEPRGGGRGGGKGREGRRRRRRRGRSARSRRIGRGSVVSRRRRVPRSGRRADGRRNVFGAARQLGGGAATGNDGGQHQGGRNGRSPRAASRIWPGRAYRAAKNPGSRGRRRLPS